MDLKKIIKNISKTTNKAIVAVGLVSLLSCTTPIPEKVECEYLKPRISIGQDTISQYNIILKGYIPRKPTVYIHYIDNKINYIYE